MRMDKELVIPESEVRKVVRLVGAVADMDGSRSAKRRALMTGLSDMINADAWAWIINRAADDHNNPAVAYFQHGGYSDERIVQYARIMQDRENTPVEYKVLNQLRLTNTRFTRRWDQLVTPEEWYGPRNRPILDALGFEHVLYCVKVLDDSGLFSGITLKRRAGRPNFTPLEQRIAHIVTGEIDWLHGDENLNSVTREVSPLPPSQRTVLMLLMEGKNKPTIALELGCSYNTVKDHVKAIYAHFKVHSTAELFHHFQAGDGLDA
jgi:DNA-binding CsgD family transcriptional regulator